jgi:hypothetical protein
MYNYKEEKPKIFKEENQELFLAIRTKVLNKIKETGAIKLGSAIQGFTGDSWVQMACVDRLVELGEIKEIPTTGMGQDRIFV